MNINNCKEIPTSCSDELDNLDKKNWKNYKSQLFKTQLQKVTDDENVLGRPGSEMEGAWGRDTNIYSHSSF